MCGCKRRRAARAAWIEQRAVGRGGCGRGFGSNAGPPFRPPFMGGPFGRWKDTPRDGSGNPTQLEPINPRNAPPASRDVEKTSLPPAPAQQQAGRVSSTSIPFSRSRDSIGSDNNTDSKRQSTTTLPPRYTSGVPEVDWIDKEKEPLKRESLPPAYTVATKR